MSTHPKQIIEIASWHDLFENADSRKRQRLGWYMAPSGCDSRGYRLLMRNGADGLIAFGVFNALCQLMATLRKDTRESGKFINSDGTGMEPADLWEMTRIQPADFETAVNLLSDVGWLILHCEEVTEQSATYVPPTCHQSASVIPGLCKEKEKEKEKEKTPIVPKGTGANSSFDEFWETYPRKVGKETARKSFERAMKKTDAETILGAIERQKQSSQWQKDNGEFIPHPTTWLNRAGWEDELDAVTATVEPQFTQF